MADIETCAHRFFSGKRTGFPVLQRDEAEVLIRASNAFTQDTPQHRTAQGELAPGPWMPIAMPPGQFLPVQRPQRFRFPRFVGSKVNVNDGSAASITDRTPPGAFSPGCARVSLAMKGSFPDR
ncbi:MAG: hypothetical protein OXI90_00325 [Gammaproteobacteria bacterium]|nr:hypothetical protein [Gammaproteobacteria bacterium]